MRILLTGTTTLMANQKRQGTSTFLSFFIVLHEMLQRLGHKVDWRATVPGEPLAGRYDLALLGLQAVNGLAGKQYRYGTLWAATELPHAVVFDDWQVTPTMRSLKKPTYMWRTAMLGKRELAEHKIAEEKYFDLIDGVRAAWSTELPLVLAPLFAWGDHAKFARMHPMRHLGAIDPSAFVPKLVSSPVRVTAKERRWVLASLIDQTYWHARQGFTWPVVRQHAVKGKRGWGRVPEAEVVDRLYRGSWGVLAPRYNQAIVGTGWWRSRFNFAVQTHSVLYADPADVAPLGIDYTRPLGEVERMSSDQLIKHAGRQILALQQGTADETESLNNLQQALRLARKHGPPLQLR